MSQTRDIIELESRKRLEEIIAEFNIDTTVMFVKGYTSTQASIKAVMDPYTRFLVAHEHLNAYRVSKGCIDFYSGCKDIDELNKDEFDEDFQATTTRFTLKHSGLESQIRCISHYVGNPDSPYLSRDKSIFADIQVDLHPLTDNIITYPHLVMRRRKLVENDAPFVVGSNLFYDLNGDLVHADAGIKSRGNLIDWDADEEMLDFSFSLDGNSLVASGVNIRTVEDSLPIEDFMARSMSPEILLNVELKNGYYTFNFKAFGKDLSVNIAKKIDPALEVRGIMDRITKNV